MLSVPVDYSKPDGDVAQIAMIRFKATGQKIGSLVVNPGGPGESGVEAAASMVATLPQSVRERFDLVGFDPRGVANSAPAAWCNSDADNDRLRADPTVEYTPGGRRPHREGEQGVRPALRGQDGQGVPGQPRNRQRGQGSRRDTRGLGDDKLTYSATRTAPGSGRYAEAYPDKVRAMILDGAVDPNADQIEEEIRQAAAFQKAFDNYAADCANSPDCPLGTDPAKAVDVYKSLVDPLVENPAKTRDPRGLSYNDAIVGTILPLYSPSLWRHLTQALSELKDGTGDTMLGWPICTWVATRGALQQLHRCPGRGQLRGQAAHHRPRQGGRTGPSHPRGGAVHELRRIHRPCAAGTCAFWPVPATGDQHEIKVTGLPPILVVSTTNDPATPYQAGVDLAQQLGGTLVTFDGTQHTVVFQGNTCVDDIAARYLVDVTVPPPETRC